MRKLISSYLILPIIVISLSACDPAYIKNVKVTAPVFDQSIKSRVIGADLLENVLNDIDEIANRQGLIKEDVSQYVDPLWLRTYYARDEDNPLAARGVTRIDISISEDNSCLIIHFFDFPTFSQSQLSQNVEQDLTKVLTKKYGLNWILQK